MDTKTLDQAWQIAAKKPYKGRSLADWLNRFMYLAPHTLDQNAAQFLPTMTAWLMKQYREGRKGGVPTGYLEKFASEESQKVPFFDVIAMMVIRILRKRGLREWDEIYNSQATAPFQRLVEAWDRAKQQTQRR